MAALWEMTRKNNLTVAKIKSDMAARIQGYVRNMDLGTKQAYLVFPIDPDSDNEVIIEETTSVAPWLIGYTEDMYKIGVFIAKYIKCGDVEEENGYTVVPLYKYPGSAMADVDAVDNCICHR